MTQPDEARIITAMRPASSMPTRAGSLTLKMTPSFIRAHGTGLPAALALSGGFQIIRHALASFARKRSCRRKPAEACHEDHRVCELADCR